MLVATNIKTLHISICSNKKLEIMSYTVLIFALNKYKEYVSSFSNNVASVIHRNLPLYRMSYSYVFQWRRKSYVRGQTYKLVDIIQECTYIYLLPLPHKCSGWQLFQGLTTADQYE